MHVLVAALLGAGCAAIRTDPTGPAETSEASGTPGPTDAPAGGGDGEDRDAGGATPTPRVVEDPLAGRPTGEAARARLCALGNEDAVARALCATPPPKLGSLADVYRAVGLGFASPRGNAANGNPAFALTAHSTALSSRFVSAINPAVIVFSPRQTDRFVATMFVRGEPTVELVGADPTKGGRLNFYLVRFEQPCDAGHACTNRDRLTGALERGWTGASVYADQDLADTTLDCLHCHQPDGPGRRTMLRMQERVRPWTHWLDANEASGRALLQDYLAAHGDEEYGGVPSGLVAASSPATLEAVIDTLGPSPQPNEFDGRTIEGELRFLGQSPTWQRIFGVSSRGGAIPVPFAGARVTDGAKLAAMTDAYRTAGTGSLPDIRDVLSADALIGMGARPTPDADGEEILVQMCAQCHNGKADPGLGRSRFDALRLTAMPRAAKDAAIARLALDPRDVRHMPPARFKEMTTDETARATAALRR